MLKLVVDKDDPTITVVMDCECENTVGFPLERLKSRIRLLQDHYPCRLASLLVVNLPPEMRGFAQEVLKVHTLFVSFFHAFVYNCVPHKGPHFLFRLHHLEL